MEHSIFYDVPMFVTATTPQELIKAMIKNNIEGGTAYKYFQVLKDGDNWIAWYLGNASKLIKLSFNVEAQDGAKKNNRRPRVG